MPQYYSAQGRKLSPASAEAEKALEDAYKKRNTKATMGLSDRGYANKVKRDKTLEAAKKASKGENARLKPGGKLGKKLKARGGRGKKRNMSRSFGSIRHVRSA